MHGPNMTRRVSFSYDGLCYYTGVLRPELLYCAYSIDLPMNLINLIDRNEKSISSLVSKSFQKKLFLKKLNENSSFLM